MDGWIPHLLTKLDHIADLSRDLLEQQRDHTETLSRIENRQFCQGQTAKVSGRPRGFDWQKIVPTLIWGAVILGLALLQIPLKDAVQIATKLSGAG